MSKIGRNDPCPCGSGFKYKMCCINKEEIEQVVNKFSNLLQKFMSYDEVNEMSTIDIITKLESLGIPFDEEEFLKDVEKYDSASQLSKNWYKTYKVTAVNRDKDFPWFASWILWERLAPQHILSREQMTDLIEKGYDYMDKHDSAQASDVWLKVWNAIIYRHKPEFKTLDHLESQYQSSFSVFNLCQDLEMELQNAGLGDSVYFDKCVRYCREFCNLFPDESELTLHNMRRALARSLFSLGHIEEAKDEFNRLINDYPDNPWGYIAFGDAYWMPVNKKAKDSIKAKELYEKALLVAKDKGDIDAIMERIDDLDD